MPPRSAERRINAFTSRRGLLPRRRAGAYDATGQLIITSPVSRPTRSGCSLCSLSARTGISSWPRVGAERFPPVGHASPQAGHEIACPRLSHRWLSVSAPEEFRDETTGPRGVSTTIIGQAVHVPGRQLLGDARLLWALDVLIDLGFPVTTRRLPDPHERYGLHARLPTPPALGPPSGLRWLRVSMSRSFPRLRVPVLRRRVFPDPPYWLTRAGLGRSTSGTGSRHRSIAPLGG